MTASLQVYEKMQAEGLQPTAVTYGCLMTASELDGRLDRAFSLYQEACTRGVLPTDECHNILINVCARSNRYSPAASQQQRCSSISGMNRREVWDLGPAPKKPVVSNRPSQRGAKTTGCNK